jgi:hypothetical protein
LRVTRENETKPSANYAKDRNGGGGLERCGKRRLSTNDVKDLKNEDSNGDEPCCCEC